MTPREKAENLYRDAYMRWCYELSDDKNILTAKSIAEYVCSEVIRAIPDASDDDSPYHHELVWWQEVKKEIVKL